MREIKFRGLTLNGEWHYGNLAILTQKIGATEAGSYISNSVGVPFAYAVRPETVNQFTGLLDKNGKEIWEGDIVLSKHTSPEFTKATVIFQEGCFLVDGYYIDAIWDIPPEVIGNIYENPDLLTKEP